jgi:hypothetical protein
MKPALYLLLAGIALVLPGNADEAMEKPATAPTSAPTPVSAEVRFAAVNVFVDSLESPLGAYQFELTATDGDVKLAGLEGGDHAAFRAAPFYDPGALLQNKVIVAAYSTASSLPRGKTRVATLHVQITGSTAPRYRATITAAASGDGKPIAAQISISEGALP